MKIPPYFKETWYNLVLMIVNNPYAI